jgi:anaerobic dimethyl sulfoxide reductase subunit A
MGSSSDGTWIPTTCFTDCGGQKCLLKVEMRDGRIARIKTDDVGEDTASSPQVRACGRGYALEHILHSDARIKYPMTRRSTW